MQGIDMLRAQAGDVGDFSEAQIHKVCSFLKSEVSNVLDLPDDVLNTFIKAVEADLRDSMAIRKPLPLAARFIADHSEYFSNINKPESFLMSAYVGSTSELGDDVSWLSQGDIVVEFDEARLRVRVSKATSAVEFRRDGGKPEAVPA